MMNHCTRLIVLFMVHQAIGAQLPNCPEHQIKFEKLIGLRPNLVYQSNILISGTGNTPVTLNCIDRCSRDIGCSSFLLYYNTSSCYFYTNESVMVQNFDYDSRPDTNVVWFRKTCLKVPQSCNSRIWTFEIVSGAILIGYDTKHLQGIITRQQCMQYCLAEQSFLCRSAQFRVTDMRTTEPRGVCTLSNTDRHLIPNAFRVSRYEDEYIENECVNASNRTEYCNYEEYDNTELEHTDLYYTNFTRQQCQMSCDTIYAFNCRGYTLVFNVLGTQLHTCLLHSEDSRLIGPKLLIARRGSKYYEKVRCLNMTVSCTGNNLTVNYWPEQDFNGRIYADGYSEIRPCYAEGKHDRSVVTLQIPLNESRCGVVQAYSTGVQNRTLRSMFLVIQYIPMIQTQGDRLLKVGCVDDDLNQVTLGADVNFTDSFPNRGSTVFNTSSVLPVVTMRVLDYNTKQPTSDTEIGQELQLIIEIKPGNGPYDMWASNLIASSDNGYSSIVLIDGRGCPTDISIFPPFTKTTSNDSRTLTATFQAFKFSTSPIVRFTVMVHFCTMQCPVINCNRQKRQIYNSTGSINATVHEISGKKRTNNTDFDYVQEIPLDILLLVRTSKSPSDKFVVGENDKILVAGYDFVTDEVCLDYSLFVGLMVVWVLLQVIIVVACYLLIRRYKKYFDIAYTRYPLDESQGFDRDNRHSDRRVRWADQ